MVLKKLASVAFKKGENDRITLVRGTNSTHRASRILLPRDEKSLCL